ncbi:MAG: tetratricopeptide repeat protein [bacterium]|nr:tetratricopeptide repeat protein [bacterium]
MKKKQLLFIGSVAIAFIVRALHIWMMSDPVRNPTFLNPITDGAVNHKWAVELLSGNWPGNEPFFRAPGFTYLLGGLYGLFDSARFPVQLVLALFASLAAGFNALTANRLWGTVAGWISGIITALLWTGVWFAGELLDAAVFASMLSVVLWLLTGPESKKRSIVLGLILGVAVVFRPIALVLLPLLFFRKQNRVLILIALLLPIIPVTIHNTTTGAALSPIAVSGGTNFYIGNNQYGDGRVAFLPGLPADWQGESADVIALASRQSGKQMSLSQADKWFGNSGLKWLAENPGSAFKLYVNKLRLLLAGKEYSNNKNLDFWRNRAPVVSWFSWCSWAFVLTLAVVGVSRSEQRRLIWYGAILLALSMLPFFINARFRLPLMMWLVVPAAGGAELIYRSVKAKKPLPAKVIFVALLAFLVSGFAAVAPDDPSMFNSYRTLGNSYIQSEMYREAATAYDHAITSDAEWPHRSHDQALAQVFKMRGEIYTRHQDIVGVVKLYQKWVERLPDDSQGKSLLGWALLGSGDPQSALKQFRIAGDSPQVVFGTGMCFMQLADPQNAIIAFRNVVQQQPDYWQAWGNLASLLDQQGKADEALVAWKQLLKLKPDDQRAIQRVQGN